MKYRYITTANGLFVPQYKTDTSDVWTVFKKDMIKGDMLQITESIACLSDNFRNLIGIPRAIWSFSEKHENESLRNAVFFTKAIYVMAFIGAAQHWWAEFDKKEVGDILK